MNFTTYFFGKTSKSYCQYPYDDSKVIFDKCQGLCRNKTSFIAVHRRKDLIYYTYITGNFSQKYKVKECNTIGLCVVINKQMFKRVGPVFGMFENLMETFILEGELLKISSNGISYTDDAFDKSKGNLARAEIRFNEAVNSLQNNLVDLPAISYSGECEDVPQIKSDDDEQIVLQKIAKSDFSVIIKDNDNYSPILQNAIDKVVNAENEYIKVRNNRKKISTYQVVAISTLLALFLSLFVYFLLANSCNKKEEEVETMIMLLDREIQQKDSIANNITKIKELIISCDSAIAANSTLINDKIETLRSKGIPLVLTYVCKDIDNPIGKIGLTIKYAPLISTNARLKIRLYDSNGVLLKGNNLAADYTHIEEVNVAFGVNECVFDIELDYNGTLNPNSKQPIEVWCNGYCLYESLI